MIGSTVRLLSECERLAEIIDIPKGLDPEDDEVWEAADAQGKSEMKWKKYGVESFVCLTLIHACQQSLKHQSAIVFC